MDTTSKFLPLRGMWVIGLLLAPTAAAQMVLYVDGNATGAGNGSSWCNAFVHLQSALAVAGGIAGSEEIRVAQGTYRPDRGTGQTVGNRLATFPLPDGVTLLGGFAGCGAADPEERDFVAYETILSGDLNGNDGPDFANYADNSYHVVTYAVPNAYAVLDGFTVSGGNADGTGPPGTVTNQGGAVHIRQGQTKCIAGGPVLRNCRFRANWADHHGAVNDHGFATRIENCSFEDNYAGTQGAGLLVHSGSPTITHCKFINNVTLGDGGGLWMSHDPDPSCPATNAPYIVNSLFTGNHADRGGGAYNEFSSPTLDGCTFTANSMVSRGGGLYHTFGNATVLNSTFQDGFRPDPTLARGWGAGIYIREATLTLRNSVIARNSSYHVGGIFNAFGGTIFAENCTFWGNISNHTGDLRNEGRATLVNCTFRPYYSDNYNYAWWPVSGVAVENLENIDVVNCHFERRNSGWYGGSALKSGGGTASVSNSLFIKNHRSGSSGSGGVIRVTGGTLQLLNSSLVGNDEAYSQSPLVYTAADTVVSNCIFWLNGAGALFEIGGGTLRVEHCLTESSAHPGVGNIAGDPLFMDMNGPDGILASPDDNWRLAPGSPAANAGNSAVLGADVGDLDHDGNTSEATPFDFEGNPRVAAGALDLGAFERPCIAGVYGDVSGIDDVVELGDVLFVLFEYGSPQPAPEADLFPCGGDGLVELSDITAVLAAYAGPPTCANECQS